MGAASAHIQRHFSSIIPVKLGPKSRRRCNLSLSCQLEVVAPVPKFGGYLLIKSYGFWSDVEHVIGALLLAEMTGRTPVVHWGGNSYFTDDERGTPWEPSSSRSRRYR